MTKTPLDRLLRTIKTSSDRRAVDAAFAAIAADARGLIESLVRVSPPWCHADHRQVATIALHDAITQFRPHPTGDSFAVGFWPWARRVIHARLTSERRREVNNRSQPLDAERHDAAARGDRLADFVEDEAADHAKLVLGNLLSAQERMAFVLFAEGRTYHQIASAMRRNQKSVGNALTRARVKLRTFLSNGQTVFEPRELARFMKPTRKV